jgi:hypothetical protein
MRKSCAKTMGISTKNSGNEQILYTPRPTAQQPGRVKSRFLPQLLHSQAATLPQPKTAFSALLNFNLSPQSTAPINTITIHY